MPSCGYRGWGWGSGVGRGVYTGRRAGELRCVVGARIRVGGRGVVNRVSEVGWGGGGGTDSI